MEKISSLFDSLPWYAHPLLVLAGFAAGIVNTLAGNGSAFTLSALIFFGLPANVANGTNRVGVVLQGFTAISVFRKHNSSLFSDSLPYLWPSFVGAIAGAYAATQIDPSVLNWVIGWLMVGMLLITIFNPNSGLKEGTPAHPLVRIASLLVIGFYGGFIQAGIGVVLLLALVPIAGLTLVKANAVKTVIVMTYSLPVLLIFVANDQVDWLMGSWLALGQFGGSYVAAKFMVRHPKANVVIKWVLIAVILASIVKLFGLV